MENLNDSAKLRPLIPSVQPHGNSQNSEFSQSSRWTIYYGYNPRVVLNQSFVLQCCCSCFWNISCLLKKHPKILFVDDYLSIITTSRGTYLQQLLCYPVISQWLYIYVAQQESSSKSLLLRQTHTHQTSPQSHYPHSKASPNDSSEL